jgi:hypothetical protein
MANDRLRYYTTLSVRSEAGGLLGVTGNAADEAGGHLSGGTDGKE